MSSGLEVDSIDDVGVEFSWVFVSEDMFSSVFEGLSAFDFSLHGAEAVDADVSDDFSSSS